MSLGIIDELGYLNKIENGQVKIYEGSLVMNKSVKREDLYHLDGETLTGKVAIAEAPEDHRRLGYISIKGLEVMQQ